MYPCFDLWSWESTFCQTYELLMNQRHFCVLPSNRGTVCCRLLCPGIASPLISPPAPCAAAIFLTKWQMGVLPLAHQPACRVRKGIRELGLPELELFEVLPSPVEHQVPGNDSQSGEDNSDPRNSRCCSRISEVALTFSLISRYFHSI